MGTGNPAVCYSRRSYARNRDRINQTRSRKRKEGELGFAEKVFHEFWKADCYILGLTELKQQPERIEDRTTAAAIG